MLWAFSFIGSRAQAVEAGSGDRADSDRVDTCGTLMKRAGEGLSRDAILDAVWGRHFIGDLKIVDVNIRRIRQKLEDEPSEPQYIETLWGFGYRWKRSEAT